MTPSEYLANDVLARIGVALLLGGGLANLGLPLGFSFMAAGIWLLVISIAMARG